MKKIIDPVDVALLKAELTPDKKICDTNKAGNEVYVVDGKCAPNVLREIGRLREEAFRQAGESSGNEIDIDEFDTRENSPYQQIVIWDPDGEAILGGYRFILGSSVPFKEDGQPDIYNSLMFHFSDKFIKDYLPYTLELGRSFVAVEYQSSKAGAKGIYTLDNLWDGIGAVIIAHPSVTYMFGNMTVAKDYDKTARDVLEQFLLKHFPDTEDLVKPISPAPTNTDKRLIDMILVEDDFKRDYRILKSAVRSLGTGIPPLVNSYMNTSPTMKVFGTGIDKALGGSSGTAILINFFEMYDDKRERHVYPYLADLTNRLKKRFPNLNTEKMEMVLSRVLERRDLRIQRRAQRRSLRRARRQK